MKYVVRRRHAPHYCRPWRRWRCYDGNRSRGQRISRILWCLAVVFLAISVLYLTVVPGVRFSGYLSAAAAGVCAFAAWLRRFGSVLAWRIFCGFVSLGVLCFFAAEAAVLAGERTDPGQRADAVIVLGAGVYGTEPSPVLQSRIEAAADYLQAHPDLVAVLSGGQGPGEDLTEAEVMRQGLVELGIDESRLRMEEQSTSTAENFTFSKALLEEDGIKADKACIAVVTNEFHCFRAGMLARRAGLNVFGVPARTPHWWLGVNYHIREAFAVMKTLVLG